MLSAHAIVLSGKLFGAPEDYDAVTLAGELRRLPMTEQLALAEELALRVRWAVAEALPPGRLGAWEGIIRAWSEATPTPLAEAAPAERVLQLRTTAWLLEQVE